MLFFCNLFVSFLWASLQQENNFDIIPYSFKKYYFKFGQ